MMLKTWRNGAKASEVKNVIDYNFNVILKFLTSKGYAKYMRDISVSDWMDNSISIPFSKHGIESPFVQLFIEVDGSFDVVLGGVKIDPEHNITLSTDLPFDGKVVVK